MPTPKRSSTAKTSSTTAASKRKKPAKKKAAAPAKKKKQPQPRKAKAPVHPPFDPAHPSRPLIGAHMSIAGGLHGAIERGAACDCDIVQLFTKSNNQWKARPLTEADLAAWNEARRAFAVEPVIAHDSYLINLASQDAALFEKSVEAFAVEIARCAVLRIPYLCMHPGAHMGAGEEAGLARCAEGLDRSLEMAAGVTEQLARELGGAKTIAPMVLIETTAGQGTSLGHRFEHLRDLLAAVAQPKRYGVCLDTCHIFAAGYDIRELAGYLDVMETFDAQIGLEHLKAFHLNDSKKPLGSRVDRHEHLGKGEIGPEAFRALMEDERFFGLPMALETPKGDDKGGGKLDRENLAFLRRMWHA